jgi:hypothetical protein
MRNSTRTNGGAGEAELAISPTGIRAGIRAAMDAEIVAIAAALRRAVVRTGRQVQQELRAQARAGGFKDGGKAIANAWRLRTYPAEGAAPRTWRPAALVYSNAPDIAEAFDKGVPITAKGQRWLAFPTSWNALRGRRGASARGGVRVTPAQMMAAKGDAFVIRAKSNPAVRLWCLRVREARGLSRRGRNRVRLWAGPAEVLTGNRKGRAQAARDLLDRGFVPMFLLMKRVSLRKRLDIDAVRGSAAGMLASNVSAELRRGGAG